MTNTWRAQQHLRGSRELLAKPPAFDWGFFSLSTSWQRTLLALGPISLGRSQPGNKHSLSPPLSLIFFFPHWFFFLGMRKTKPCTQFLVVKGVGHERVSLGWQRLGPCTRFLRCHLPGISDGYLTHPDCCQSTLLTLERTWAADPNSLSGPD